MRAPSRPPLGLLRLALLAAALLVVQWAGLLHGLGHVFHDHPDQGDKGEPPAVCEWCMAYAVLGHGLSGQACPPPLAPSQPAGAPPIAHACPSIPSLAYHSRGPPDPLV